LAWYKVPGTGPTTDGVGEGAGRNTSSTGAVGRPNGALPQATRLPTISAIPPQARSRFIMTLLLLEALGAGLILVGIIWWTMFSGRKHGELAERDASDSSQEVSDKNSL
jgi:hypothetical protein